MNTLMNLSSTLIEKLENEEMIWVYGGSVDVVVPNNANGTGTGTNNADGRCGGVNNGSGLCG